MKQEELQELYAETVPYLLQWYEYNRRILPWREEPTPYHVWVSEIMLQQTRVEAVKGYYDRFLTRLPDIAALAEAEEEELLKLWEGLGYYNRVRNMQKAARIIMEEYDGEMPADYERLRALPGIGDYTAGAIASIAFGLPHPAVDGNVLRVMSRIACSEEDIAKEQTKKKLKEDLTFAMPTRSGDFNQSLMELGATVCLPNGKPLCDKCPVMHLCKAFHEERETELPVKSAKKERRIEKRMVYLVFMDEKVLLHRREKKGLLAGLWEFPNAGRAENGTKKQMQKNIPEMFYTGRGEKTEETCIIRVKKAKEAKHIFSHVEWHMESLQIEVEKADERTAERLIEVMQRLTEEERKERKERIKSAEQADGKKLREAKEWVFVTPQEMEEKYPVPSAFEVYTKMVKEEKSDIRKRG